MRGGARSSRAAPRAGTAVTATLLILNAAEVVTMDGPAPDATRPDDAAPLGCIPNGAVAVDGERIVAVGRTEDIERTYGASPGAVRIDARGAVVAPGLIDAHTHAAFLGDRAHEHALRLRGATYAEIAAAGGGIASTVRAVRAATDDTVEQALRARLARMRSFGVTTVEAKSGYGLDTETEVRLLRAIRRVRASGETRVFSTFLPLHAVDPDLRSMPGGRERFVKRCSDETLPAALAEAPDFVDAYVDSTGFSVAECRPLLERAAAAGLSARLHVGQFADVGGAELAAEMLAASADHLEHVSDAGARAMAAAGVVGILLPGAAFSLGQPMPDARRLRSLGMEIALATDCNPGTSPTENLPLMATFAVRQMGLSIVEAWWGLTRAPARSLRRDDLGVLRVGALADVCVLDLPTWEALPYQFGSALARYTIVGGKT